MLPRGKWKADAASAKCVEDAGGTPTKIALEEGVVDKMKRDREVPCRTLLP
jgi:hypothetical protein